MECFQPTLSSHLNANNPLTQILKKTKKTISTISDISLYRSPKKKRKIGSNAKFSIYKQSRSPLLADRRKIHPFSSLSLAVI